MQRSEVTAAVDEPDATVVTEFAYIEANRKINRENLVTILIRRELK